MNAERATLVTITGPSCAGKTHLEKMLLEIGFARVISNTSREPRAGEVNGVDYRFRSRDWFHEQKEIGNLIEYVEFNGNFYGNTEACVNDALSRGLGAAVWVIEPHGHKQVKSFFEKSQFVRHYSVFVDGDPMVIANRFMGRFQADSKAKPSDYAKRLGLMFTKEREWVDEARFDLITGQDLYDLYVERFDESNDQAVALYLAYQATGVEYPLSHPFPFEESSMTRKTSKNRRGKTIGQMMRDERAGSAPMFAIEPGPQHEGNVEAVERARDEGFEAGLKAATQPKSGCSPEYKLAIYLNGFPGSYEYHVDTLDQAMTHFAAITTNGYRRMNDRGQMQWYAPSQIASIKVSGPGLDTHYPDRFVRT